MQSRAFGVLTLHFVAWGTKNHIEQADDLQSKGFGAYRLRGFAYHSQGSVPGAGLAWNLVFWRQTLSIVGSRRVWEVEKNQDLASRLRFSSEIDNFRQATLQGPIFCGEFWGSRLKISSEIEVFTRDWTLQAWFLCFSRFVPLGFPSPWTEK